MENTTMVEVWGVITQSKRIINAHARHFLALSLLFLLPLSFSLSIFPTLFHTFTSPTPNHTQSLLFTSRLSSNKLHLYPSLHSFSTLSFSLLFFSFSLFFFLLAVSSVTSSLFNGFYGRPVKLRSALNNALRSFFPLLGTFVAAHVVVFGVVALFVAFGYLVVRVIELYVTLRYDSSYFIGVFVVGCGMVVLVVGNLYVNWAVANVVVVVEGRWGFEPLGRSKGLVRGMRWVAFSLMVFFGFFVGVLGWMSMLAGVEGEVVTSGWNAWAFGVQIVGSSAVLVLLLLHSIAAFTVLYMYCRALHGELAGEIVHEFAADYVSLPFDDQKVPHVVCFVH